MQNTEVKVWRAGASVSEVNDSVQQLLGAHRRRWSTGCRQIVEALAVADRPLSVAQLCAAIPTLPTSSTYRSLATLTHAGAVHRVVTTNDIAHYELAEAVTGRHHHHLICTTCGTVQDYEAPPALEAALHRAAQRVREGSGFVTTDHRLDLLGTCATCQAHPPSRLPS